MLHQCFHFDTMAGKEYEDLAALSELDEELVLSQLYKRYNSDAIYVGLFIPYFCRFKVEFLNSNNPSLVLEHVSSHTLVAFLT